jgi:hypothetical protein
VKVAISDEAANTTTVPDTLGVADGTSAVGAAVEDADGAAFFEELHPARPSATTTVATTTADAFRFMNSP